MKLKFNNAISSDILKQAVTDLINVVTIEETALSNILNLVCEVIQKAKNTSVNLEEFVAVNESVNCIIKKIAEVQNTTRIKLQFVKEVFQKIEDIEESPNSIFDYLLPDTDLHPTKY